MDETVNAGDNSCECAEIGEADYLSVDNGINGIVLCKNCPGIILVFSVAERNLFVFGIKGLDEYGYLIDREPKEVESDLVDFAAFYLKAEG